MKMFDKESQILLAVFGTLTLLFIAVHPGFTILFFKKYILFVLKFSFAATLFPIIAIV